MDQVSTVVYSLEGVAEEALSAARPPGVSRGPHSAGTVEPASVLVVERGEELEKAYEYFNNDAK